MAVTKEKKQELLKKAQAIFTDSNSAVFVHAKGMTAIDTAEMRSVMKSEGVGYNVIKKTLIAKALENSDISGDAPALDGEIAVAYGEDLIDPARLVREHEKKHKEQIAIVGGVFDGEFMNQAQMSEIANIPGVPILRGMFVNVINSPIQGMVVALNAIAEKKTA